MNNEWGYRYNELKSNFKIKGESNGDIFGEICLQHHQGKKLELKYFTKFQWRNFANGKRV